MPKKNRKSVEPVSLAIAAAHFHPRDWEDYVDEIDQMWVSEKMAQFKIRAMRNNISSDSSNDWFFDDARKGYIKEAAVPFANRESRFALGADLKSGKLVLVGYRDTGDGCLWRVPEYVWTDPSAADDWRKARVSGCGLCFVNVGVLTASEAKNVPEFCGAKEEQPERPEPPKASKGKPGPKPKWDWDAAAREVETLAEKSGGLPWPKAKIVGHLADWFSETYNEIPADSLLRDHVGKWLPLDYHDRE